MSAATLASLLLAVTKLYLALGSVVAFAFIAWGAQKIDPHAAQGTWGFRILIWPGSVLLWPWLLRRWLSGDSKPPSERNAHRDALPAKGSGNP